MPMFTMLRIGLPVCPSHVRDRTRIGERRHPVEHRVDVGHDVVAVDLDALALRRPQCHVEHGPVLGDVDVLAAEHGVDAVAQTALLGERDEEPHGLVGDAVLRVVEADAGGLDHEPLAPVGVVGEQLAQVDVLHAGVVRLQRLPRRSIA